MNKFILLGSMVFALNFPSFSIAAPFPTIAQDVGVCNVNAPTKCIAVDTNGAIPVTITPSGTQDTNLKQVNGAAVNIGTGAASSGTQRVTTSTDSTIATITNPVLASQSGSWTNTVTQTTPANLTPLVNCTATALPPSYGTGTNNPCSLTLIGAQRVGMLPNQVTATYGTIFANPGIPVHIQNPIDDSNMVMRGLSSANTNTAPGGQGYLAPVIFGTVNDTSMNAVTEDQVGNARMTSSRTLITKPFESDTNSWKYAAASGGIVNTTTAVTIKAAAGSGLRNCVTALQISADTLGAATELALRDGAGGTVVWRGKLQTTPITDLAPTFPSPICGTANTLLEIVTLTASVTGGVFVNAQGYAAP